MAKLVRMKGVDRISSLPDPILCHILSFLSTKEAVRSSILSTRWRYLFALIVNLDFELNDFESDDFELGVNGMLRHNDRISKSFMNFVDRVLFFHNKTSIEKFRLKCGQAVDSSRVYGWLSAVLWHGVQHFDLDIRIVNFTVLPRVLFTQKKLMTLKLDISVVLNVPSDVCFPNLKTLRLKSIVFPNNDSIERLFTSCVSLEEMVLEYCDMRGVSKLEISHRLLKTLTMVVPFRFKFQNNYSIVIDTPMLVRLKYHANEAGCYSLENLHSLISADVHLNVMETYDHCEADASHFFIGICGVQSLTLSYTNLEYLLCCELVPVFSNMVQLKLWCDDPYKRITQHDYFPFLGKGLANLLRDSPEMSWLEFFEVIVNYLPKIVHSCLLFKVKEIELLEIPDENIVVLAKYFLKHAEVLEKLKIFTPLNVGRERKLSIAEEVMASLRKSKQCCCLIV